MGVIKHEEQPVTVSVISKELIQVSWSCLIAVKVWVKKIFYFFIFWAKRRWNDKAECLKSSLSWAVHFFWIFSLKIPIRQWNCLLNLNNFNIFLKKYCNVYFIRSTKQSTLNKGCLFKISPIHLCHSFCILKCSWNFLSNIFHKCFWQWRQTLHLLSL